MNKKTFALGAFLALALVACNGGKQSENAVSANEAGEVTAVNVENPALVADVAESYVSWKGFKPGGAHWGKIRLEAGELAIVDGKLLAGSATIAIKSIEVEDLEGEMADKLKGHLENEDFFEAETYPTALFELTDLPEGGVAIEGLTEVKGNLTLKGITKNITIPVESITQQADGSYEFVSKIFRINRTDWNVKYGSKSFFASLGDNFIEDEIELGLRLVVR